MDQASTGLLRLNLETHTFHGAADKGWLELMHPTVSRSEYMRRLVTTYGFEAPLEAALAYTPNVRLFIDLRPRTRAGLIAKDLLALGLRANEISNLPQCLIAPFSGPIEALGWMYVVERVTLIHDRVRGHLLTRLRDAENVTAYLNAYNRLTNARWSELGHAIDRAVRSEQHTHDLIAAARSAFRRKIEWTDHTSPIARGA